MSYTVDTIRRVWDDAAGVFIRVAPDHDGLGLVEVTVGDQETINFFGDCNLTMNTQYAKRLAAAIIHACQDIEEAQ